MLSLSRVNRTVVFQCGVQALDVVSFIEMDNLVSGFGWIWFFKGSDNFFGTDSGLGLFRCLTSQISTPVNYFSFFSTAFPQFPG
jgi:hypothetical protein